MEPLPLLCWHQSRLPFALSVFFLHFVKAASSRVNPNEQEKCFVTLTDLHFLFSDVDIIQEGSLKL